MEIWFPKFSESVLKRFISRTFSGLCIIFLTLATVHVKIASNSYDFDIEVTSVSQAWITNVVKMKWTYIPKTMDIGYTLDEGKHENANPYKSQIPFKKEKKIHLCFLHHSYCLGKMNLLFVGLSGVGKTDSCCTIFGDLNFQTTKGSSVASKMVRGCDLTIVDTPGLFGDNDSDFAVSEILESFSLVPAGFTSVVFVVRMGRISEETKNSIQLIRNIFGGKCVDFITVLFTHKDQLQRGRMKTTVNEFIRSLPDNELRRLLNDCNNRFVAFDNTLQIGSPACDQQIDEFLEIMKKLAATNNSYYTTEMMEDKQGNTEDENGGFLAKIWDNCRLLLVTLRVYVVGFFGWIYRKLDNLNMHIKRAVVWNYILA